MTRILVIPENLRVLSAQLQQVAGDLWSVEGRVGSALDGLDWEAHQKAGVEGLANQACSQARALAARAEEMARYLASKAQAFEKADERGAGGIERAAESFTDWWYSHPEVWPVIPPHENLWRGLGLGEITFTVLPVAGGSAVVGLANLTPWSFVFSRVEGFGERFWNWLRRRGWKTNEELTRRRHRTTVSQKRESWSRFGELLDRKNETGTERKAARPSPSSSRDARRAESKPQTTSTQPAQTKKWWYDVPPKSQRGLEYKGQETAYGCVPTATSMILDYWHAQDPANKTMSAQELLNKNVEQGEFRGTGMSASKIHDEVRDLGYGVVEDRANADRDALQEALTEGPVIAIVKLGLKTSGANHAVVVTGISEDGQQVRINDPWTGQSYTYSWEQFSRSWGADFGKDRRGNNLPRNNLVIIRPS